MLKISEAQMAALVRVPVEALEERILRFARAEMADRVAVLGDPELRLRIREHMDAAAGLGVVSVGGVFAFVGLSLLGEGRRFQEHPDVRARLTRPGEDPDRALSWMLDDLERWATEAGGEQSP